MAKELEETKRQEQELTEKITQLEELDDELQQTNMVTPGETAKAESPKLEMDLTAQEWERWRSSWAKYKLYTRPMEQHDCKYLLQ